MRRNDHSGIGSTTEVSVDREVLLWWWLVHSNYNALCHSILDMESEETDRITGWDVGNAPS